MFGGQFAKTHIGTFEHSSAKLFCCRMNLHGQHGCLVMLCALLHALLMTSVSCVFLRPCWRAVCYAKIIFFSVLCDSFVGIAQYEQQKKSILSHLHLHSCMFAGALSLVLVMVLPQAAWAFSYVVFPPPRSMPTHCSSHLKTMNPRNL